MDRTDLTLMPSPLIADPTVAVTETTLRYARVPSAKGVKVLRVRLFTPPAQNHPHPLLIWLHSGGFRTGSIDHTVHGKIGRAIGQHGYAMAFIEYRLRSKPTNLSLQSQQLLPKLLADRERHDFGINPFFTGPAAISAVEDCVLFLSWLQQQGHKHNLGGRLLIGGSSAGAITVLNTLFLARHLGIGLPHIATAFVMSGAFAYPSFFAPNRTRILAQHSEHDPRVPIDSIRHFSRKAANQCTLLEHPDHSHGDLRLIRAEDRLDAIRRFVAFDRGQTVDLPDELRAGMCPPHGLDMPAKPHQI